MRRCCLCGKSESRARATAGMSLRYVYAFSDGVLCTCSSSCLSSRAPDYVCCTSSCARCLAEAYPGNTLAKLHSMSVTLLSEGIRDLGILPGASLEDIQRGLYR